MGSKYLLAQMVQLFYSRAASASSAKAPLSTIFGARASSLMVGTNIGVGERNVPLTSMNGDNRSTPDVKPNIEKSKAWRLTEINDPSHLRSLRLADHTLPVRVCTFNVTNLQLTYIILNHWLNGLVLVCK